jgi:hypothetical protein
MNRKRTSPERRRRQTRERTPLAIKRLQTRKRTARWRVRDALSDQPRYYHLLLYDSEIEEIRAEVRTKDDRPISRAGFRKVSGFVLAGILRLTLRKRHFHA